MLRTLAVSLTAGLCAALVSAAPDRTMPMPEPTPMRGDPLAGAWKTSWGDVVIRRLDHERIDVQHKEWPATGYVLPSGRILMLWIEGQTAVLGSYHLDDDGCIRGRCHNLNMEELEMLPLDEDGRLTDCGFDAEIWARKR